MFLYRVMDSKSQSPPPHDHNNDAAAAAAPAFRKPTGDALANRNYRRPPNGFILSFIHFIIFNVFLGAFYTVL